ncbi:MAG: lipid A biosynthesis lauroyl acyltransferase [Phyllobacteriaceae bacterium]|nr:lipid A biosynthesis lauroyl acyltransferase [Phyllobacteriaceae bacterium]MBA90503.1 lipid A biosynthesis lauroyl acyltransferase [Phyllobacteriaceae bacterium]
MKRLVYRVLRRLKFIEYWIVARLALTVLWFIKLLPAERSLAMLESLARRFGPLSGRHRVAMDNLRQAFPEKDEAALEAIARDMWGNMGRLMGEYVFLDQILDFDPGNPHAGRVTIDGAEIFEKLRAETGRPAIFFTAHMGNFELLPVAAMTYGLEVTALFRPPNNPYLAERLMSARHTAMGALVPSRAGAAFALARVLENGGKAGMLVDQFFIRGLMVDFFGREASTSPLLGKLARQFDCAIHPARCIRLPDGRFHLTLFDAIDPVRDGKGRIDVHGVTQQVAGIVEDWIRQDPGQWMWFHKRWKPSPQARRRKT